jgi:DNA repair protein RecO (recombination protein O)
MNHLPKHTKAIVLSRINYGESDRIVRFLTKDRGKITVIAKSVRKEHSKLAGGIELFSICDIGFIEGKSDIATLVSSKLIKYHGGFIKDLSRVEFVYSCLKSIDKKTAEATDKNYYLLVEQLFQLIDETGLSLPIINVWWNMRLSALTGHAPNIDNLLGGDEFKTDQNYAFDISRGGFELDGSGPFNSNHIKFLRLSLSHGPHILNKIKGGEEIATDLQPVTTDFVEYVH